MLVLLLAEIVLEDMLFIFGLYTDPLGQYRRRLKKRSISWAMQPHSLIMLGTQYR